MSNVRQQPVDSRFYFQLVIVICSWLVPSKWINDKKSVFVCIYKSFNSNIFTLSKKYDRRCLNMINMMISVVFREFIILRFLYLRGRSIVLVVVNKLTTTRFDCYYFPISMLSYVEEPLYRESERLPIHIRKFNELVVHLLTAFVGCSPISFESLNHHLSSEFNFIALFRSIIIIWHSTTINDIIH